MADYSLLNNCKITSKPVLLPSGWGTESYQGSTQWGFQDIASPGETTGDGVVDNGQIPLRMVIEPENPSTHVVRARDFFLMSPGETDITNITFSPSSTSDDLYINNDSLPLFEVYDPNLHSFTNAFMPYPGFNNGVPLEMTYWLYAQNTSSMLMDDDCSPVNINFNDNGEVFTSLMIYDWDFTTNTPGTPGTTNNSVVVLAYLNSEHDMFNNTGQNTGAFMGYSNSYTLHNYEIKLTGAAMPISFDFVGSILGNDQLTSSDGSFALVVESVGTTVYAADTNLGYDIIPYLPFGMDVTNSGIYSQGSNYTYWAGITQVSQTPMQGIETFGSGPTAYAGILFNANTGQGLSSNYQYPPENEWNENSTALPANFNYLSQGIGGGAPAFFWIVPRPGFVVSRHNFEVVQQVAGETSGYYTNPYDSSIQYAVNSNITPRPTMHLSNGAVFGTSITTQNDLLNYPPPGDFQAYTDSAWEYKINTDYFRSSFRGMTMYRNVAAFTDTDVDGTLLSGAPAYAININTSINLNTLIANTSGDPLSNIITQSGYVPPQSLGIQGDPGLLLVNDFMNYQGHITTDIDVALIDTKSYTQGLPVFNQLVSSLPLGQGGPNPLSMWEFLRQDHGGEWTNGEMPSDYCPSDWIGNCVLVVIRNLGDYIPGTNNNVSPRIRITGTATALDGSTCEEYNIDISTSDESSITG
jgi:hypothetical protein